MAKHGEHEGTEEFGASGSKKPAPHWQRVDPLFGAKLLAGQELHDVALSNEYVLGEHSRHWAESGFELSCRNLPARQGIGRQSEAWLSVKYPGAQLEHCALPVVPCVDVLTEHGRQATWFGSGW